MCGIVGFSSRIDNAEAVLEQMMDRIRHRGPDAGGKYLNDCTLYVTVEPCPMCAAALAWAQIGRIVYGTIDPKRGYSMFTPSLLHPKTQTQAGVLAEECGGLVSDFFKKKR